MVSGENVNVTNMELGGGKKKKKSRGSSGVLTDRGNQIMVNRNDSLKTVF